jgi:hypothetical protein
MLDVALDMTVPMGPQKYSRFLAGTDALAVAKLDY